MLQITLALLALVSAVVQFDFEVANSHQVQKLAAAKHAGLGKLNHKVLRRGVAELGSSHSGNHTNGTSVNGTSSNSTSSNSSAIEPLINASLTTSYNFYHGKLLVGKPAQQIDVLLDTGSPVSWVYGPQGSFKNASRFFPNRSSTFHNGNTSFSAEYGSGEYLGHWGTDLVSAAQFVAGNSTHNTTNATYAVPFEFGVVSSFATSAGAPGLLGLGPHIKGAGPPSYLSLPEAYAKNNVTSSSAFSIFLEESAGRFLFGGVDLQYAQLPFYRFERPKPSYGSVDAGTPTSWTVFLDTLKLNNNSDYIVRGHTTLDTGSPVSLLPPGFVDQVGKQLNMTSYGRYETYYVNGTASKALKNSSVTFNIGRFHIDIPVAELLVPGELIWLDDGPQNVTALSFMGSQNYLLGDSFFRHVYAVLDPAKGDVLLSRRTRARTNVTVGGRNATNASSVIPFTNLLKNSSAIRNGTAAGAANSTALRVTSSEASQRTGNANLLQNRYLGTVPAEKAASLTASSTQSGASSTGSSSASSTSSASKSKSSNAAYKTALPLGAGLAAVAAAWA